MAMTTKLATGHGVDTCDVAAAAAADDDDDDDDEQSLHVDFEGLKGESLIELISQL